MYTIYDVAKKSGVSASTVSKVFNHYAEVSQKTKDKVFKIADEMGYIANSSARSLKTNRSHLVGVTFSEDAGIGLEHQFFSVVLESFRQAMGAYGYDTLFINKTVGERNIGYLEHCMYRNVDGLFILTAQSNDKDFEKLIQSDIKCVTTDVIFDDVPYVMSNNAAGARLAVEYLKQNGHMRIAHISGPLQTLSAAERQEGFLEAMHGFGLPFEARCLIATDFYSYQAGYDTTLKLFDRFNKEEQPTALFVSADIMAIGAIHALESMGLKVPRDISVIGFDDIEIAAFTSPRLTTIKQDKIAIGKQVAEILHGLIIGDAVDHKQERLPVSLIEGGTVQRIKKS